MYDPIRTAKIIDEKYVSRTEFLNEFYAYGIKHGVKISRPTLDNYLNGRTVPDANMISHWARFLGVKEQIFFSQ